MSLSPLCKIIGVVRARAYARRLSRENLRRCVEAATDDFAERGSLAIAISKGQRLADKLSGKRGRHPWRQGEKT